MSSRIAKILFILLPLLIPDLSAQSVGTLDESFGLNGTVGVNLGTDRSNYQLTAIQSNGHILVGGSSLLNDKETFEIFRLTPDGDLDFTFGPIGINLFRAAGNVRDMVLQPDGKIMLVGVNNQKRKQDFLVKRLLPNGFPDPTFGVQGTVIIDLGGNDEARKVALQPNGKIVIAGNTYTNGWAKRDFCLIRLFPDGKLDKSFGQKGKQIIDVGKYDQCKDLSIQSDGSIWMAGIAQPGSLYEMIVISLDSKGKLDSHFDKDGIKQFHMGSEHNYLQAMTVSPEGDVTVMGHAKMRQGRTGYDWILAKAFDTGEMDFTFGLSGMKVIDLGGMEYAADMALQDDGNLLLTGTSNSRTSLVRLNEFGKPDPSFGNKGTQIVPADGWGEDRVSNLVIQPNGKILVTGVFSDQFALHRYLGNPFIVGLRKTLNFDWELNKENQKDYAGIDFSEKFQLHAWIQEGAGKEERLAGESSVVKSGINTVSPVANYINQRMHLAVGKGFKLTVVWDIDWNAHFYLNGKFLKTVKENMIAIGKTAEQPTEQKPMQNDAIKTRP